MKHGVQFELEDGTKVHTADYGLVLGPFEIPTAEARTQFITVEGGSGSIDASEAFGLCYKTVTFEMTFTVPNYDADTIRRFKAYTHGKRARVTIYNDPDYFYDARINVGNLKGNGSLKSLTIKVIAEPYKLKQTQTEVTVNGNATVTIENDVMPTVPTFQCAESTKIVHNGVMFQTTAGVVRFADIVLTHGYNELEIQSTGKTVIVFQEGAL